MLVLSNLRKGENNQMSNLNDVIITTPKMDFHVYTEFQGSLDSLQPLFDFCKNEGFVSPEINPVKGFGVIANIIRGLHWNKKDTPFLPDFSINNNIDGVVIGYTNTSLLQQQKTKNGTIIIEDWRIVKHLNKPDENDSYQYQYDTMIGAYTVVKAQISYDWDLLR